MSPELFSSSASAAAAALRAIAESFNVDFTLFEVNATSVDTDSMLLASSPTGGASTANLPERLTELGRDPVGVKHGDQTAIQDAYMEGPDGSSKMDKAADAVKTVDGMSDAEKAAFDEALKHPEKMRITTVGELKLNGKEIVMGDGPGGSGSNAKKFLVDLPPNTGVRVGEYTYMGTDGKMHTETFYIFEQCANPAVDAGVDPISTTETTSPEPVAEPTPKPAVSYKVDPYHVDECGCGVKKLLVADIKLPNNDPNSPESIAVINAALAEIQAAQRAAGNDFHDFTAITYTSPDGDVVQVQCLKEGENTPHDWNLTKADGSVTGKVTGHNISRLLDGSLEGHGDNIMAPPVDAKVMRNPEGSLTIVPEMPDRGTWVAKQTDVFKGDVLSEHTPSDVKALPVALAERIPDNFFDMSFNDKVEYFKNKGLSEKAARDMVFWLDSYHRGGTESVQGDTFDSFLKRAFERDYTAVKQRMS